MRRSIFGLFIVLLFAVEFVVAAEADWAAVYIGGTANLQQGKEGILVLHESALWFADWQAPYSQITALGYGRHARHNWDYLMLPGGGFVPALLIKSKDHYLSIAYTGQDGKPQAASFKVGKQSIQEVLKALEIRSGKKIQYENEGPGKTRQQTSGNKPPVELSAEESSSRQRR